MLIGLRARERIYVNGAVLRADRKVVLEFLNDVDFLLEQHVMQVDDATTPVRQLYFAGQAILLDRDGRREARALFLHLAANLGRVLTTPVLRDGIDGAVEAVVADRPFDALRILRRLFDTEAALLRGDR